MFKSYPILCLNSGPVVAVIRNLVCEPVQREFFLKFNNIYLEPSLLLFIVYLSIH